MAEGPYEKGEVRTWERDPKVPIRATKNVVVWAWVVKEFPYMKQNERIKFIRVGDTVKNSRPVQGRTHVEWGGGGRFLSLLLYPGYKEWDGDLAGHLLIG